MQSARSAAAQAEAGGQSSVAALLLRQDADVGQIAVVFREIETVTDDEFVGDLKTYIFDTDRLDAPVRFVQEGRDFESLRMALLQQSGEVVQGHAAVDDVFHDENVLPLDVHVQIACQLHLAGSGFGRAVAGDGHELDTDVGALQSTREVGHEDERSLEDGNEIDRLVRQVGHNFLSHFLNAALDLVGTDQHAISGLRGHAQCALSVVPYGQESTRHLANQALVSKPAGADVEDLPNWAAAAKAAESKKAVDLRILDLREITSFTDYFVICTATNPRQAQAISDEVHKTLKDMGELPVSLEGFEAAEWILMDYGDFLVHIFSESARSYYDLERLWRHAKAVTELP